MKNAIWLTIMTRIYPSSSHIGVRSSCSKIGNLEKSSNMGTGEIVEKVKNVQIMSSVGNEQKFRSPSLYGLASYIGYRE